MVDNVRMVRRMGRMIMCCRSGGLLVSWVCKDMGAFEGIR